MNSILDDIKPETLTLIESQAKNLGMSIDDYLRCMLPPNQRELGLRPDSSSEEFEADMASFAQDSDDSTAYNGTYSRDDIYFDHD